LCYFLTYIFHLVKLTQKFRPFGTRETNMLNLTQIFQLCTIFLKSIDNNVIKISLINKLFIYTIED